MIRKKISIEKVIIDLKKQLDSVIKGAIERENADNETVEIIKKELDNLRSETCFEDTIEGKIKDFEKTAFHRIDTILRELSEVTGRNYQMSPPTPPGIAYYSDSGRAIGGKFS
jgi:histidyl-tRNA synthetase